MGGLREGLVFREPKDGGPVRITYVVNVNPNGWIPTRLVNIVINNQAMNVSRIRNKLAETGKVRAKELGLAIFTVGFPPGHGQRSIGSTNHRLFGRQCPWVCSPGVFFFGKWALLACLPIVPNQVLENDDADDRQDQNHMPFVADPLATHSTPLEISHILNLLNRLWRR